MGVLNRSSGGSDVRSEEHQPKKSWYRVNHRYDVARNRSYRTGKTETDGGSWLDTNGDNVTDAGELIVYQLLVVNVGTVTLDSIVLTDGSVASEGVSCESGMPDALIPGQGVECHATYTVSESVDAGDMIRTLRLPSASVCGAPTLSLLVFVCDLGS